MTLKRTRSTGKGKSSGKDESAGSLPALFLAFKVYYGKNVKLTVPGDGRFQYGAFRVYGIVALSGTAAEVASHGSGCLTREK
jgi:hypothetical protein